MIKKSDKARLLELLDINEELYVASDDESIFVEYKETFEWGLKHKRPKYLKTMAAFANRAGGYLVFGITDDCHVVGIDEKIITELDTDDIHKAFNSMFHKSIVIDKDVIDVGGVKLGVFYTKEAENKIILCSKEFINANPVTKRPETILSPSDVYYRYPGSSTKITPGDFEKLIDELIVKRVESKNNEQHDRFRQSDVMPRFKSGNPTQSPDYIQDALFNEGGTAFMDGTEKYPDNDANYTITKSSIHKNNMAVINCPCHREMNGTVNQTLHIDVLYKDIDRRKYKMEVYRKGRDKLIVKEAVELN